MIDEDFDDCSEWFLTQMVSAFNAYR